MTKKRNISVISGQVSIQDVKKKVKKECRQCGKTFGSLTSLRDNERAKNHNVITDKKSVSTMKSFVGAGVQNQQKDMKTTTQSSAFLFIIINHKMNSVDTKST